MKFFQPNAHKRMAKSVASSLTNSKLQNNSKLERPNKTLQNHIYSNPTATILLFSEFFGGNISIIDSYSLLYAIKACTQGPFTNEGKQIHALVVKFGCEPIIFLQSSLINFYSTIGKIAEAHKVFDEIPKKNVVCWTNVISAYVDNNKPNKTLQLFRQMQMEYVEPDAVTLTVVLSACADLGALYMGRWIHGFIRQKNDLNADLCLKNALVNMFMKCGDVKAAKGVFDLIEKKDVATWTSMIIGYAINGRAEEGLQLFAAMEDARKDIEARKCAHREHSIAPNDVTFLGVLMACSHAGLLQEGKEYFRSMTQKFRLKPRHSHYGCMVDLFCRSGMLKEAYEFILAMPIKPNAVIWRTLLGGCSIHGNLHLACVAHQQLLELEGGSLVSDNVIMSNVHAAKGMWDKKLMLRDEMKHRRIPGCSSIEVGNEIHEFRSTNCHHPFAHEIYLVLDYLVGNARNHCYRTEISMYDEYDVSEM